MQRVGWVGLGWAIAYALLALDLGIMDVLFPFAAGSALIGVALFMAGRRAARPLTATDGEEVLAARQLSSVAKTLAVILGVVLAAASMLACLALMFAGGH